MSRLQSKSHTQMSRLPRHVLLGLSRLRRMVVGFWSNLWSGVKNAIIQSSEELDWARTIKEDGLSMLQIKIRNFLRRASLEERLKRGENLLSRTCLSSTEELKQHFVKVLAVYQDEVARLE